MFIKRCLVYFLYKVWELRDHFFIDMSFSFILFSVMFFVAMGYSPEVLDAITKLTKVNN